MPIRRQVITYYVCWQSRYLAFWDMFLSNTYLDVFFVVAMIPRVYCTIHGLGGHGCYNLVLQSDPREAYKGPQGQMLP